MTPVLSVRVSLDLLRNLPGWTMSTRGVSRARKIGIAKKINLHCRPFCSALRCPQRSRHKVSIPPIAGIIVALASVAAMRLYQQLSQTLGRDGSVFASTPPGECADRVGPQGSAHPTSLFEAAREPRQDRRRGRRSDLRGSDASDDAVRRGKDGGAAGGAHVPQKPRSDGAKEDYAHQRLARPFG